MGSSFEPVTLADLKSAVVQLIPGAASAERQIAALGAKGDRVRLVGLASLLFFVYERGHNPRVSTIADAALYCSTALAAGHGDVQPVTTAGKLVGTLLLALSKDNSDKATADARVLETLEAILGELRDHPPRPHAELAPPPIPPVSG